MVILKGQNKIWNSGGAKSGVNDIFVHFAIKVDVHIKRIGFNKMLP